MKTIISRFIICVVMLLCSHASAVEIRGPQFTYISPEYVSISIYANMKVPLGIIYGIKGEPKENWNDINDSHATQHHFNLRDLKPDTDYQYSFRGLEDKEIVRGFKTPAQGAEETVFCAYGQSRRQNITEQTHRQLISRIQLEKPQFVVHTGNMLTGGQRGNPSLFGRDWTQNYFTPLASILENTAFYLTPGQHDISYMDAAQSVHTVFPKLKRFSFQVVRRELMGMAIITVPHRLSEWKDCAEAIEMALKELDGARWRFVCMHVPPYASGMRDWMTENGQGLMELFERYRIDVVFSGRQQQYQRTVPMHVHKTVEHAITIVNTGLGMEPLNGVDNYIAAANDSAAHYVRVSCGKQILRVEAIDLQGRIFDTYKVDRHHYDIILDKTQLFPADGL